MTLQVVTAELLLLMTSWKLILPLKPILVVIRSRGIPGRGLNSELHLVWAKDPSSAT